MLYSQNLQVDSLKLLLSKENTDTARVRLLNKIGFAYGMENFELRLRYHQQAAELAHRIGYKRGEIESLSFMAEQFNLSGNYSGSLQISLQNLRTAEQVKDTEMIFWIKREILRTHYNVGDYKQVIEDAQVIKSLVHSGAFRNQDTIKWYSLIGYVNWFSNAYIALNQFDSALYYTKISYRLSQELKNTALQQQTTALLSLATNHLADLYMRSNKFDTAFSLYKQSIDYGTAARRFDVIANSWLDIADLFNRKGQLDSAFHYVYKSLALSRNFKSITNEISADSLLSNMYHTRHQSDSAYKYLQDYITLRNRLFNQSTISQIQSLTFSEKLRQQQLQQERKEEQQEYQTKLKVYSLSAGLAILLLVALFLYRNNKVKQKSNVLLQEQKQKVENAYAELKTTQAQLIQSEKMASLGELTAGIAHEIQNPLNFVNNFSEVNTELIEELQDERSKAKGERDNQLEDEILNDVKQNLEKILHHGKRADAIVKGMLQHSRTSAGQKELTDINALADEYLRLSYHGFRAKDKSFNATLQTDFDSSIGKINIVPQDIGRVLLNLFNNAFYGVTEKKKQTSEEYEPTVSVSTKKLDGKILISVKDNGIGIPQKVVEKIFQPFFTTKPTGQGTGLGLSLSYDIIKAHGGEIKVESKEGEGAKFAVQLLV